MGIAKKDIYSANIFRGGNILSNLTFCREQSQKETFHSYYILSEVEEKFLLNSSFSSRPSCHYFRISFPL
jgi:hypothetical protein